MANYYATSRSNYFKVKDNEKFKEFCGEIGVEMITQEDLVGFIKLSEKPTHRYVGGM